MTATITEIMTLVNRLAELPEEVAARALAEYERTSGHNDAISAIFAIGAELRKTKAGRS